MPRRGPERLPMSSPEGSTVTFRRVPADIRRVATERFARKLQAEVTKGRPFDCLIAGDAELRRLNREFRGRDYATDVLSFPVAPPTKKSPSAKTGGGTLGDVAISLPRARAQARQFGHSTEREIRIIMLHGGIRPFHRARNPHPHAPRRPASAGHGPRDRFRPDGARRKALARAIGIAERADRAGGVMIAALAIATIAAIPLLALVTFVQLLYLESLRLRPRDLPSLEFFKDTLEDKLGLKTEDGAGAFSLIKHTLLALLGVFSLAWFANGEPYTWSHFWQAALAAWLTMSVASYAVPQLLYRRTRAQWLMPLAPLLRAMAWTARPCGAALGFFQSLIELANPGPEPEEAPTSAESIEALISAGAEEGLIEEQDRELMQSVVEFGDRKSTRLNSSHA